MFDYSQWTPETCRCITAGAALDLHSFINPASALESAADNYGTTSPGTPLRAKHILGFAAEKYNISKDIKDFAAVPIIIMPSDLPNRNKVGFPLRRLSEFDTNLGMLAYESWRHMPTHTEHANSDYTKAKGIVLDVGIRPMRTARGDLWKVNALLAFDRGVDPDLVNDILTKKRTAYSMGAYVGHYSCSICGAEVARKDRPTCDHVDPKKPQYDTFMVNGQRRLAHWNTGPFKGFEVSSVGVPAYVSAINPELVWQ